MTERARIWLAAVTAGIAVAIAVVAAGVWLAGVIDGTPEPDGTFVLDEPGIFEQPTETINADMTGRALPDVALSDAHGNERRLSELRGRPLIVNFWFSTCAPCRRELGDFAAVHVELGDEVQFVGVDPFDTVEAMERFAAERGVGYPLWRDTNFALSNELEIVGYPVTLFVSPEGRILRQTGEIDRDDLRAAIEELF